MTLFAFLHLLISTAWNFFATYSMLLALVATTWTVGYMPPRMYRQARANAQVRAARRAREAYRAPVIDITHLLPLHETQDIA